MLSEYLSFFRIILFIASAALFVYTLIQWFHRKRPNRDVVQCRTGTVGAGKTFLDVHDLIFTYKRCLKAYRRRKNPFWIIFGKTSKIPPVAYSNIPVYLGKERVIEHVNGKRRRVKKEVWSYVLKREYLLFQKLFRRDAVVLVLWDEIGLSCNQYAHSDPNIVSANINDNFRTVDTFIRFFRHVYGEASHDACRLWATDQATGEIVIALRRRFGMIDYLNGFRRFFGFLPFYKIDVRTMLMSDDQVQNVNNMKDEEKARVEFYMGFLPYRRFSKKRYDSHAFSEIGNTGIVRDLPFDNWGDNDYHYIDETTGEVIYNKFKTNYCPDLRMTLEERRVYEARLGNLRNKYKIS